MDEVDVEEEPARSDAETLHLLALRVHVRTSPAACSAGRTRLSCTKRGRGHAAARKTSKSLDLLNMTHIEATPKHSTPSAVCWVAFIMS